MAKYQVETEDGVFEVETEDAPQAPSAMQKLGKTALQHGPMAAIGEATQMAFEQGGQNIAENLASGVGYKPNPIMQAMGGPAALIGSLQPTPGQNQVNPNIAAAIGTAVQMAPDIATSFAPIGPAAKVTERGLGAVGRAAKMVTGPGEKAVLAQLGEQAAPLTERLLRQQEAMGSLPGRIAARQAGLQEAKAATGKAMGQAEKLGGFEMGQLPPETIEALKNPEFVTNFGKTMRNLVERPINDVVTNVGKEQLQIVRKMAQAFEDVGTSVPRDVVANIRAGGSKAGEALGKIDETFGIVRNEWKRLGQRLDKLPLEKKAQKAAIQGAIRQTRMAIKETNQFVNQAVAKGAQRDAVRKTILTYALGPVVGTAMAGSAYSWLFK